MKKIILLLLVSFMLTGCSLLPRLTFDSKGTVPQAVDKSKVKEICKGKAEWDINGQMISCSSGYYRYNEGYSKIERKMTISEKIKSFINGLMGMSFWIIIALLFLCPSLLGFIGGRLIEGSFGVATTVGKRLIKAIQKTRKSGKDLNDSLDAELDVKDKQYIRQVKDKNEII
jgi:hypothetical protein